MATRLSRRSDSSNIWPGFVDAISTLLIIVIFLLMIFTIAQFFLSEILSGRNSALDRLNRQIAELGEVLALEKKSNEDLRQGISELSTELQGSISAKDRLQQRLAAMNSDRDQLAQALTVKSQEVEADREKIEVQLATLQNLRTDIEALKKVRAALETKVSSLASFLEKSKTDLSAARDRSKRLEARLSNAKERTSLAKKEIKDEKALSQKSRARLALLNQQIAALRQQLARISSALEASEEKASAQNVQILNLGSRLNEALANKVEELVRFRSEFFGKLRKALGMTKGVRVEGDRFVFQSEVLFPSGSASMFGTGQSQISQLAGTLKDIAARIPKDVDWILRVDGHTDNRPIKTSQFPSNWELSSARAIAVVKQLIAQGIPPHRLAATGFGEFRPLDTSPSVAGLSRNRRIEFKLTGR